VPCCLGVVSERPVGRPIVFQFLHPYCEGPAIKLTHAPAAGRDHSARQSARVPHPQRRAPLVPVVPCSRNVYSSPPNSTTLTTTDQRE